MALVTAAAARAVAHPHTTGWEIVRRNFIVYRSAWVVFLTGFLEPVLYLFSIGIGVGQLLDSTFGIFFKLRYDKVYEGVLATPMRTIDIARGELAWSLMRSAVYSAGFVLVMTAMGLVSSWWAVLAWPATWLIGFAFSGAGMALTTFMNSWQDFEYVQLAIVPMFLFSATFFPVTAYDGALRWVVEATPLYRGVTLTRELTTGALTTASLWSVLYLVVMGLVGVTIAARRFDKLLLS